MNGASIPNCAANCTVLQRSSSSGSSEFDIQLPVDPPADDGTLSSSTGIQPVDPVPAPPPPASSSEGVRPASSAKSSEESSSESSTDADDITDSSSSSSEESVSSAPKPEAARLRCYSAAGELTEDRSKCDPDQQRHLRPEQKPIATQEIDEEVVREELRKKLLGDDIAEKHRKELLDTMQNARERMLALKDTNNFRQEVLDYFDQSIAWLDRGITYFSEQSRSLHEVQQMVAPVRQLLSQATGLVQQEKRINAAEQVTIDPILEKTERLLLKFREAFIALSQGGVSLDPIALAKYGEAAEIFVESREACINDHMACKRLNDILAALQVAQGPLEKALSENPEIYQKVQEKFSNEKL